MTGRVRRIAKALRADLTFRAPNPVPFGFQRRGPFERAYGELEAHFDVCPNCASHLNPFCPTGRQFVFEAVHWLNKTSADVTMRGN